MRLLVQRVSSASVRVEGNLVGQIEEGALVLVGFHQNDEEAMIPFLVKKLVHLRFFPDERGRMHYSLLDTQKAILAVSQFTLYGNCNNGRRPDFGEALEPKLAKAYYELFLKEAGLFIPKVETGIFGAYMEVESKNDGPVTFLLEA